MLIETPIWNKDMMKQPVEVCSNCDGWGYTEESAPIMKNKKTVALGSGCPVCKGTGKWKEKS